MVRISAFVKPFLLAALFVCSLSSAAAAQDADPLRIILLETIPVDMIKARTRCFVKEMDRLGYHEGDNLIIRVLEAQGNRSHAEALLQEALSPPPDLFVAGATLAAQVGRSVLEETGTPLLFSIVVDPLGAGLLEPQSDGAPVNVTGKIYKIPIEQRLELALSLLETSWPADRPIRIGYIYSAYPSSQSEIQALKTLSTQFAEVTFVSREIPFREMPEHADEMKSELREAMKQIGHKVDFWWELTGPLGEMKELTEILTAESTAPVLVSNRPDSVRRGALLYIGEDTSTTCRELAFMAHSILQGKPAHHIPVTPPSKLSIQLNLDKALEERLIVPQALLELAEGSVYRSDAP